MKNLDEKHLAKARFGIAASLDDLFDGFIYCRQETAKYQGTWTVHPDGWYFFSGIDASDRIVTFPPGRHPGPCLYTKPKEHVKQAVLDRAMEGKMGSFEVIPWPEHGYALVHATDSTMIPSIWLAFVPLDSLPEINPDNTSIWSPA